MPTRSASHNTVQADVTALVAKTDELARVCRLAPLKIPNRVGTSAGLATYLSDINAITQKVNEISAIFGLSRINIGRRRISDGSAKANDINILASRLNKIVAVAPTPSTSLESLRSDFGMTLAPFTASSPGVIATGGRAQIPVNSGYRSLLTRNTYTLLGSSVHARLYGPLRSSATTDANIGMSVNSGKAGTSVGTLINMASETISFSNNCRYYDAHATVLPYSPAAHAWVRLSERSGQVRWDTSSDGVTWINRRVASTPAWLTIKANQNLQFSTHRDSGNADFASVALVNGSYTQPGSPPVAVATELVARAVFGLAGLSATRDEATYQARMQLIGAKPHLYGMFANFNNDLSSASERDVRRARAAEGATLMLAWMPQRAYGGNVSMQTSAVMFTDILAGAYDSYIRTVLAELGSYPGKVIIRFAHEMNLPGSEYSPGRPDGPLKGCFSTADFIRVWRYMVDTQRAMGLTNIQWMYCPNGSDGNSDATIENCWPGSAYVDWTGFDTYRMFENLNVSFDALVGKAYKRVTALPGASGLPVAIGEIGANDFASAFTKSQWIAQMFQTTSFPNLKAVTYFDQDNWAIDAPSSAIPAFQVGFQQNASTVIKL